MAETNTRQASRAPVTLKIKFKSETLDQFIERYSVDISHGGIFIRTKDPLAVGTSLKFEFQLKDATPLITGQGTVVWTREHDPERAGISPGMGVRFDKLPNESQKILDTVLAKKGGKLLSTPAPELEDDDGADDFVDTPTRVAPAALVDSLTSDSGGYGQRDLTPLPQPMPFHGDDDFDDAAFSESTKVASLDSILAQAKGSTEDNDDYDEDAVFASTAAPRRNVAAKNQEESKSETPAAKPSEYEDPFGDLNDDAGETGRPDSERADSRAETTTMPRKKFEPRDEAELDGPSLDESAEETDHLDFGADDDDDDDDDDSPSEEDDDEEDDSPATMKAAVLEPANDDEPSSSMPWIAVAAVILLIGGAGGFWLLNKGKQTHPAASQATGDTLSKSEVAPSVPLNTVKAPVQPIVEEPAIVTKEVTISTQPEGATVTVQGSNESAVSPATFELEEGKSFTVVVTHDEFLPQTIDAKADGSEIEMITLVAMPKVLRFTSEPSGAIVMVNGQRLKGRTPVDLPVNRKIAQQAQVRVQFRSPGYRPFADTLSVEEGFVPDDEILVNTLHGTLKAFPKAPSPSIGSPGEPDPRDADASGDRPAPDKPPSDKPAPDKPAPDDKPASDKPAPDKPASDKPAPDDKPAADKPAADKPAGEPTPDWMK